MAMEQLATKKLQTVSLVPIMVLTIDCGGGSHFTKPNFDIFIPAKMSIKTVSLELIKLAVLKILVGKICLVSNSLWALEYKLSMYVHK